MPESSRGRDNDAGNRSNNNKCLEPDGSEKPQENPRLKRVNIRLQPPFKRGKISLEMRFKQAIAAATSAFVAKTARSAFAARLVPWSRS